MKLQYQAKRSTKLRRRTESPDNVFNCLSLDIQQSIASFLPAASCMSSRDLREALACPFPYIKLRVHTTTDLSSGFCLEFFEALCTEQDNLREITLAVRYAGAHRSQYFMKMLNRLLGNRSLIKSSIDIGVIDAYFFALLSSIQLPNGNFSLSCSLQLGRSCVPSGLSFSPSACQLLSVFEYAETVPVYAHLCSILAHCTKLRRLLINLRCCTKASKEVYEKIAGAVQRNRSLEVCTIHGCYLETSHKADILKAALAKESRVSRLSLTNCNIEPADCDLIVRLLSENTSLKHLNLMGNQQVGNAGALAFFKCTSFSDQLDLVELRDCRVSYSFVDSRIGNLREVRYDVTL